MRDFQYSLTRINKLYKTFEHLIKTNEELVERNKKLNQQLEAMKSLHLGQENVLRSITAERDRLIAEVKK